MARRKKATGSGVKVDFTGVEGAVKLADDDYHVKCVEVSMETSESSNKYLAWVFRTVEDDKGPLYYNTSLQPQALWNLRNLLETFGLEVPDGPMDLDLKAMPGNEMIAVVENETYEGKKRPKIVDFMPVDGTEVGEGGEAGEDEVPSEDEINEMDADDLATTVEELGLEVNLKKAKTLKKKRSAVITAIEEAGLWEEGGEEEKGGEEGEGGEDELYTADEINEMNAKELQEVVDEYGLEGINLKKIKRLPAKRKAVVAALEEADLLDTGEEGGDEKLAADDVAAMDLKELQGVIKDYELDLNLKKFKTLRKKANAVIDALEEAGALEEEGK